jgi:hypothetical protein
VGPVQAEGYRYLARLVRAGLENFLECADPNAPKFTSIANGSERHACDAGKREGEGRLADRV